MESIARVLLLLVLVAVMLALANGGWPRVKQLVNSKFATRF
jgi:hypothetical protein